MASKPYLVAEKQTRGAKRASEAWRLRIGAALRRARERGKLTQGDLGALVGVDWTTISRAERGESVLDYATIETIADVLGPRVDEVVGRSEETTVTPPADAHHQELEARVTALEKGLVTALATAGDALALAQRLEQQRAPRRTRASGS